LDRGPDFEWVGLWRRPSSMCHVKEMSKTVGPCFAGRVRARSARETVIEMKEMLWNLR
jgi:hypothetical protein